MSAHWTDCWLIHPACAIAEIHRLKSELGKRSVPTFAGYRPPVFLGNGDTGTPPPIYTHSVCIPCGDPFYTHHGDEPPSSTL